MVIRRIAVIGAGYMGSGIAQVCAQAGYDVSLVDLEPRFVSKATDSIRWSLEKLSARNVLSEPVDAIMARLSTGTSMAETEDVDLAIEAVFEDEDVKIGVMGQLCNFCRPDTILTSTTSTIPISRLAETIECPQRVVGLHFFGPVPLVPLVEVIPTGYTRIEVVNAAVDFVGSLGKKPLIVRRDMPGFVVNRVLGAMACEAISLVERGVASINEIDDAMCDGIAMRIGPLAICDRAGLDICLNAFRIMHELDPDHTSDVPELLEHLVASGDLGVKSGKGFYRYDEDGKRLGPAF